MGINDSQSIPDQKHQHSFEDVENANYQACFIPIREVSSNSIDVFVIQGYMPSKGTTKQLSTNKLRTKKKNKTNKPTNNLILDFQYPK